jgi:hypothetical protein
MLSQLSPLLHLQQALASLCFDTQVSLPHFPLPAPVWQGKMCMSTTPPQNWTGSVRGQAEEKPAVAGMQHSNKVAVSQRCKAAAVEAIAVTTQGAASRTSVRLGRQIAEGAKHAARIRGKDLSTRKTGHLHLTRAERKQAMQHTRVRTTHTARRTHALNTHVPPPPDAPCPASPCC